MAEVSFSHVRKVYPDGTAAVRDLTLDIEDVTEGEIRVGGRVVNDVDPSERDIAMVFQTYALYPHMTVGENIGFPLKIAKLPSKDRAERVREVARTLGLEAELD